MLGHALGRHFFRNLLACESPGSTIGTLQALFTGPRKHAWSCLHFSLTILACKPSKYHRPRGHACALLMSAHLILPQCLPFLSPAFEFLPRTAVMRPSVCEADEADAWAHVQTSVHPQLTVWLANATCHMCACVVDCQDIVRISLGQPHDARALGDSGVSVLQGITCSVMRVR